MRPNSIVATIVGRAQAERLYREERLQAKREERLASLERRQRIASGASRVSCAGLDYHRALGLF